MHAGDVVVASTLDSGHQPALNGRISVKKSTGVHVGHRIYYNAPVNVILPDNTLTLRPEQLNSVEQNFVDHTVLADKKGKFQLNKKRAIILAVAIVTVIVIVVIAVVLTRPKYTPDPEWRIVTRADWKADPPRGDMDKLSVNPPLFIVISHSNTPECFSLEDCKNQVKYIQELQYINTKFSDIAYNFLVGGDGNAYEGRGWDMAGSHTKFVNNRSIGINFIGDFMTRLPPQKQIDSFFKLVQSGYQMGKLIPDYKIYYARQFRDTLSPGDKFISLIETWDRWAPVTNKTK